MQAESITTIGIVGPTASGKSNLADLIALEHGTTVVSADAMQVYRGMDIGTAKTPVGERKVPLECVDLVGVDETYSVALYAQSAHACIDAAVAANGLAVVCGGTGLYVRAALEEMDFPEGDQLQNPVRDRYNLLAEEMGPEAFHGLLASRDPESASLIHPNNVKRVVRAFELLEQGTTYAAEHATFHVRTYRLPTVQFGLDMPREVLYERINRRVDIMVASGLFDEVARLDERGIRSSKTAAQAIGYKEVLDLLDGNATEAETVEKIKQNTRRYAKRQLTWFRADARIVWIDGTLPAGDQLEIVRNTLSGAADGRIQQED